MTSPGHWASEPQQQYACRSRAPSQMCPKTPKVAIDRAGGPSGPSPPWRRFGDVATADHSPDRRSRAVDPCDSHAPQTIPRFPGRRRRAVCRGATSQVSESHRSPSESVQEPSAFVGEGQLAAILKAIGKTQAPARHAGSRDVRSARARDATRAPQARQLESHCEGLHCRFRQDPHRIRAALQTGYPTRCGVRAAAPQEVEKALSLRSMWQCKFNMYTNLPNLPAAPEMRPNAQR